jgi:hypothetical protein
MHLIDLFSSSSILGPGHWQNGQWVSGANGKSVELALPALAVVAVGMLAL